MDYALGAYEPDRPIVGALDKDGRLRCREASYVYRLLDGYIPVRAAVPRSGLGTLDGACRGAAGLRTSDGTRYLVAGTAAKLWLTSAGALVDRTGAAVPALSADQRWTFAAFDTRVLAASVGVDGIQSSVGAGFTTVSADAPKANHIFVLEKFLVAADITGRGANAGYGTRREGVHWCARGDVTSWPAFGTDAALNVQSDFYPLRDGSGPVTLGLATGTYGFLARERAAWRMDYTGDADIMAFEPVEKERGCVAPGGGLALGSRVYFPSEEGFLVFDGERCTQIGFEKIDRTWAAGLTLPGDLDLMSAGHDFENRTIWFLHPTSQMAFLYNYLLDEWTTSPLAAEWIFGMLPISESMDSGSMSAANMDTTFGTTNMDALGPAGSNEALSIFTTAHQPATLDGDRLATGHVKTCRFGVRDEGGRALVRSVRPIDDNEGGTLAVSVRGYLTPDATDKPLAYRAITASGLAPARAGGRYHELDFLFGGEQTVAGFDLIAEPQGDR